MANDFVFWDLGKNRQYDYNKIWLTDVGVKYGRRTQELIQEVMPIGFTPGKNDAYTKFKVILNLVWILTDAGELNSHREWLNHKIRAQFDPENFDSTINLWEIAPPSYKLEIYNFEQKLVSGQINPKTQDELIAEAEAGITDVDFFDLVDAPTVRMGEDIKH